MDEYELHKLVLSKCHRVPLDNTIEQFQNPTGILASEYKKIRDEIINNENIKS